MRWRAAEQIGSGPVWPALLPLTVAVLAPTALVLWFVSDGIAVQGEVARQRLADAYLGQTELLATRVDALWETRASMLQATVQSAPGAAAAFHAIVTGGLADAVVIRAGERGYPFSAAGDGTDPEATLPEWIRARRLEEGPEPPLLAARAYAALAANGTEPRRAARALQAQIRSLLRANLKDQAVAVALGPLSHPRFRDAKDPAGRLIAADALLMSLQVIVRAAKERTAAGADPRFGVAARRLHKIVSDYRHSSLSAGQRLFLMREFLSLPPLPGLEAFATFEAETLAGRFLEAEPAPFADSTLRATAIEGVWKFGAPDGRAIALYRAEPLIRAVEKGLMEAVLPAGLRIALQPPGKAAALAQAVATRGAGARMPGWHLTLYHTGTNPFDEVTQRQTAIYVWAGVLAIAAVSIMALLAGRAIRFQARLAALKADLAAAVTHELKTPISSIRLLADTLLAEEQMDPVKTREYLELISRENLRLGRLIDNFLAFSRMERRKSAFDLQETGVAAVVESAVGAWRERVGTDQDRLVVDVELDLPAVRADADALATALVNLLDNAYKYSPPGKRIALRVSRAGGEVRFAVEDQGIGIDAGETRKIFRKFYQIDRRLSRNAGGVGLGLSIVDFIIRAHRGRIEVTSEPGRGSTFMLALPAAGLTIR